MNDFLVSKHHYNTFGMCFDDNSHQASGGRANNFVFQGSDQNDAAEHPTLPGMFPSNEHSCPYAESDPLGQAHAAAAPLWELGEIRNRYSPGALLEIL